MLQASPVYRLSWRAFFSPAAGLAVAVALPAFRCPRVVSDYVCSWRPASALRTDRPNLIFPARLRDGSVRPAAARRCSCWRCTAGGVSHGQAVPRSLPRPTPQTLDASEGRHAIPSSAAEVEIAGTAAAAFRPVASRVVLIADRHGRVSAGCRSRVESCRGAGPDDPARRRVLFVGRLGESSEARRRSPRCLSGDVGKTSLSGCRHGRRGRRTCRLRVAQTR